MTTFSRHCRTLLLALALAGCARMGNLTGAPRVLSQAELASHVKGGWAGQMIGVTVGGPTEFKAQRTLYTKPLAWNHPEKIKDSFGQDDLYVEMTFAEVMDHKGLDASMLDYGQAFGQSKYHLWHANKFGRDNIRAGIMPPASGDPAHNAHWRDIDFQIEADFIGLMCPGMPNECRKYCDRVGHVMNYGEGVYGGLFISAMYAAAFFEKDPEQIVRAGVAMLPPESITARALGDVLRLHQENPTDWQKTWAEFNRRWDEKNEPCPAGHGQPYNIDAFVNSAYVAIGLLYGGGDFKQSTAIATACGQDSDCNAASAAGILGTALGYEALPADWRAELEKVQNGKFSYTNYSFDSIVASTLKRAGEAVVRGGGQVRDGKLFIPQSRPVPPALETWTGAMKTKD